MSSYGAISDALIVLSAISGFKDVSETGDSEKIK